MGIGTSLTFKKNNRLKSRKLIEHLFSKGKGVSAYPVKVLYDVVDDTAETVLAGVTVSSKKFKKAVDRNRIKRILREAYRLQQQPLQSALQQRKLAVVLFFLYTGKELPAFMEVYEKLGIVLDKIENIIKTKSD